MRSARAPARGGAPRGVGVRCAFDSPPRGHALQLPPGAVDTAPLRSPLYLLPLAAAVIRNELQPRPFLEHRQATGAEVVPVLLRVRVVARGAGAEPDGDQQAAVRIRLLRHLREAVALHRL